MYICIVYTNALDFVGSPHSQLRLIKITYIPPISPLTILLLRRKGRYSLYFDLLLSRVAPLEVTELVGPSLRDFFGLLFVLVAQVDFSGFASLAMAWFRKEEPLRIRRVPMHSQKQEN